MWPFAKTQERTSGGIWGDNPERRTSIEDPKFPLSSPDAWRSLFGLWESASGITVTPYLAMGVPAFWCAVNFLSDVFAWLPVDVFRKTSEGRQNVENDPVALLLHDWVNDDYLTTFEWRKGAMMDVLCYSGRHFSFIERNAAGVPKNLWPLDPGLVTVERVNGRRQYRYRESGSKQFVYQASEIIDMPFLLGPDRIRHIDPVQTNRDTLGLAIALEQYASRFFQNGGVPPLALQMPAGTTPGAARRASQNIDELIRDSQDGKRLILPMPLGHRLEALGFDPQKGQLTEARKFMVLQIGRIYNLPPVFLHDLENATYANAEQQDLILVKHSVTKWLNRWEKELNAKLMGPRSNRYIEFNVDGLLRGDFTSRMEGLSKAVQNAIFKPNEARELMNRMKDAEPDADKLHIQGATVPLGAWEKIRLGSAEPPSASVTVPAKEPT